MDQRLLALNAGISGRVFNEAKTGAKMVDLDGQLTTVASRKVDYLTVLMGANDGVHPAPPERTNYSSTTLRPSAQVASTFPAMLTLPM